MFCGNCGSNNPDGAVVCGTCGAPLTQQGEGAPSAAPEATGPSFTNTVNDTVDNVKKQAAGFKLSPKIIGIAAAAVVVIVVLIIILANAGGGAGKAASNYVNAFLSGKTANSYNYVHKKVLEEEDIDKEDINDYAEEADEAVKDYLEDLEDDLDGKVKFSIEVRNEKDVKSSELRDIKEEFEDEYDLKVTDAKTVKLRINAKAGGDTAKYDLEIPVVKIGGKWYVASALSPKYLESTATSLLSNFSEKAFD